MTQIDHIPLHQLPWNSLISRWLIGLSIGLILLFAAASTFAEDADPATDPDESHLDESVTISESSDAETLGALKIAPPNSVMRRRVYPLAGEALQRANLSRSEILETLERPSFIRDDEDDPVAEAPASEPSREAINHYIAGKNALANGNPMAALRSFEEARKLAPSSPTILRQLGTILYDRGNRTHGAAYLRMAVRFGNEDADVFYRIAEDSVQRRRWSEVIFMLDQIPESAIKDDPILGRLVAFHLGEAMLNLGFDVQAIAHLQSFLDQPRELNRRSPYLRSYLMAEQRRAALPVLIADAHVRLGQLDQALKIYREAAENPAIQARGIAGPLVYSLLLADEADEAVSRYIGYLRKLDDPVITAELADLLNRHAGSDDLVSRIRKLYQSNRTDTPVAAALIAVSTDEQILEQFADHPFDRPEQGMIFRLYFAKLLKHDRKEAIRQLIRQIERDADLADQFAETLIGTEIDAKEALIDYAVLPESTRRSAPGWYVRGVLERLAGNREEAVEAYRRAIRIMPTFDAARLAMVDIHLIQGEYGPALELMEAISADRYPRVTLMRVRALRELGRYAEALRIIDDLVQKNPDQVEYHIEKADIHRRLATAILESGDESAAGRQFKFAEQSYLQALRLNDRDESIYMELFKLYEGPLRDPVKLGQLLRKIQATLPGSKAAGLYSAQYHLTMKEWLQAESILEKLKRDYPDDLDVMTRIVILYRFTDRLNAGMEILEAQLEKYPNDHDLLMLLRDLAREMKAMPKFYSRYEKYLRTLDPDVSRSLRLVSLYLEWERFDQAESEVNELVKFDNTNEIGVRLHAAQLFENADQLDRAIAQLDIAARNAGEAEAEVHYMKSWMYSRADRKKDSEKALADAIKANPQHAPSNNDLGYSWADRGENLDEAERMIRIAVNQEPTSAAYLDSLGWVLYKKGQFKEAAQWLSRANAAEGGDDPIIVDHLGDAYWRVGDKEKAIHSWRSADQRITEMAKALHDAALKEAAPGEEPEPTELPKHYRDVQASVKAKLEAVKKESPPLTAPVKSEQKDANSAAVPEPAADAPVE